MHDSDPTALPALSDSARQARILDANGVPILDLVQAETPYWGEVPQQTLQEVLQHEDVESAFDRAVRALGLAHLSDYALDIGGRSAWAAILSDLETTGGSLELAMDVGAGYGANTVFLAERFESVVATDVVPERLEFIGRRCRARGLSNVLLVRADFEHAPLRPAVADLVVCNGVLEWVGAMDNEGDPAERQLALLRALALCLKPKGRLYIGIENRFGLPMWRGAPDHSGLPFTSLLPRPVAKSFVYVADALRAKRAYVGHYTRQRGYRTYTHSPTAWRNMLAKAGLSYVRIFGADDYNRTRLAFPMGQSSSVRALRVSRKEAPRAGWFNHALAALTYRLPAALLIHASPRETEGAEEQVRKWLAKLSPHYNEISQHQKVTLLLIDTRSADAFAVRYVIALSDGKQPSSRFVLTRMPEDAAEHRSFRRVRLAAGEEAQETEAPVVALPGEGLFLLEPLRDPPSLLAEARHQKARLAAWVGEVARDALKPLLQHLTTHERRWTAEDTTRLIALAPEPFVEAQLLKEVARRLEGTTLRFGVAHGDLAPENLFREGSAMIVDDWNETVMSAPVAMDAVFFAATSAWAASSKRSALATALGALRPALTPDEFSHREHLLALALLHWRTLGIPSLQKWARERVSAVLQLLGAS